MLGKPKANELADKSYDSKKTEQFDEELSESTENEEWENKSLHTDVAEHETQATTAANHSQDLERGPTDWEPPNYEERAKDVLWKIPVFCICLLVCVAVVSLAVVLIAIVAAEALHIFWMGFSGIGGLFSAVFVKIVSRIPGVSKTPHWNKRSSQLQWLTAF